MLDCGLSLENHLELMNELNPNDCLITHSHGDHCNGLLKNKELYAKFKNIYTNESTKEKLGKLKTKEIKVIENKKRIKVNEEFEVIPFEVPHDVECHSYLIRDTITKETILYLTDTGTCNHIKIKGVNHFIIECNHDERTIDRDNFKNKRNLSAKGHLSLQQCLKFLHDNITKETQTISLVHISQVEGSCQLFENEVKELVNNKMNYKSININYIDNKIKKKEFKKLEMRKL